MNKSFLLFLFVLLSFVSNTSNAFERPKIGLVLSGGGAKGSAHVGVLRVLEKNNVPIDYIAGTSIGAYVGGLYALGYNADEIEKIMMSTTWDDGYSDTIPRESLHYEEKKQSDQYNIPLRLGYEKKQVKAPSGILIGQTMTTLLRQSTGLVNKFDSFDELAIPYRAIAADLETSLAVIIDSGSLVQAMKASAAIPGALQPVTIDDKLLVDGGLANNMPVDVVKAMGADIVIAVDIGSSLTKKENIKTTIDVLNQLSTILTSATTEKQKKLLEENDILIRPEVGDLSTTDWEVLPVALELGLTAALAKQEELKKYALDDASFKTYMEEKADARERLARATINPIKKIVYQNDSKLSERLIKNAFDIKTGNQATEEEINAGVARVFALDKFEHVDVEFIDEEDGRILILNTRAKAWGPNYFKLGFSLQESFSLGTVMQLDLGYVLTDITSNGGAWKNEISLGYEQFMATELYLPLSKENTFFGRARAHWQKDRWRGVNQDELAGELTKESVSGRFSLGYNLFDNAIAEAGVIAEYGGISYQGISGTAPDYTSYGGFFSFGFDNLNSINFPTSGNQLMFNIYVRNDNYDEKYFGSEKDKSVQYTVNWRGALSLNQHTFVGIASYAQVDNETDYTVHLSQLGGFLNLSAYQKNELVGAHKVFGALVYHYDLGRDVFGLTQFPVYLGTSLETGNVWLVEENIDIEDLIVSGSLFFGTDTSLGPAAIGIGFADTNESSIFISIGKSW